MGRGLAEKGSVDWARSQAIHEDRLWPVRAANPQAPSLQASLPPALLSLAQDSLALDSSRVEHLTAPRPDWTAAPVDGRRLSMQGTRAHHVLAGREFGVDVGLHGT
jgi:hypothetical protein